MKRFLKNIKISEDFSIGKAFMWFIAVSLIAGLIVVHLSIIKANHLKISRSLGTTVEKNIKDAMDEYRRGVEKANRK